MKLVKFKSWDGWEIDKNGKEHHKYVDLYVNPKYVIRVENAARSPENDIPDKTNKTVIILRNEDEVEVFDKSDTVVKKLLMGNKKK